MPIATQFCQWGSTRFDTHQVHTYVRWACAQGIMQAGGLIVRDDACCWADKPIATEPFSTNDGNAWSDPVTDQACWIDASEPASYEFLGFAPYLLDYGQFPRQQLMANLATAGGRPGQVVVGVRSIRLVGTLFAATPEGAAFGADWLHRVFADDCSSSDGYGQTLTFRRFCPTVGQPFDEGTVNVFDCVPASLELRPWSEVDTQWWQSQDMEIAILAGQPWLFGCATQTVLGTDTLADAPTYSNIERFVSPDVACGSELVSGNCPEPGC